MNTADRKEVMHHLLSRLIPRCRRSCRCPDLSVVSEHSINAKLLYALLLNRTMLSQKSGWVSEDGNVYVIYTIKQMANDLNRSERTVKTALCELENAGLLTRVRQGWNQANRMFPANTRWGAAFFPSRGQVLPNRCAGIFPSDGQKLPTSNTNTEYKEQSKTESRREYARRRYGEYQNVFLSGEEYCRLERLIPAKLPNTLTGCRRTWLPTDRHYANHYATIRSGWTRTARAGAQRKTTTYRRPNEGECL